MANLVFNPTSGMWVNLDKPGGRVYFVGGGTVAAKGRTGSGVASSDTNDGLTPEQPKLTIQAALNKCTTSRGDTVAILPGSITITAALTMSLNDVTLTGVGAEGGINPSAILVNGAVDGIAVTGTNVVIEDLHFPASTAAATARINAGAAGLVVQNCTFECGVNDLETITIPAAGLHTTIKNNRFYVTANGPDAAIEIESASAHFINIIGNTFHGQNDTNAWDVGAINSGVANLDMFIHENNSTFGPAYIFSAAATGMISRNLMGEGTLGSMLDPGSAMCFENYEADAIDQSARLFPGTVAS